MKSIEYTEVQWTSPVNPMTEHREPANVTLDHVTLKKILHWEFFRWTQESISPFLSPPKSDEKVMNSEWLSLGGTSSKNGARRIVTL